ncbi:MAG: VOC family protein [Solirubrobacteraceae bacterium]|nr:VOC family protein [Solirubrobacteraceae bacterium]
MPSGPLAHICFLVEDLDKAIEDWTKILGVLDPAQLEQRLVRYDDFDGAEAGGGGDDRMAWATFVNPGGAEIQLMAPGKDTHLGKRLAKHGEHVHHVCFTTEDPAEASRRLAEQGIEVLGGVNQDPEWDWQQWTWVSPKSAHGTLVEVAKPYRAVDGQWVDGMAADAKDAG